jgi:hypothetical protein
LKKREEKTRKKRNERKRNERKKKVAMIVCFSYPSPRRVMAGVGIAGKGTMT